MPRCADGVARRWPGRLLAALLLAVFAAQAMVAAQRDSVTVDEFLHLAVGYHALTTGDFRQDPINTHVPRMIAALPLLADPPVFAPRLEQGWWSLAYHLMDENADRYHAMFVGARAMIVLLSLLAALVMARWAKEMYGGSAALVALALFASSPSLLAHGHLVTLDMAGTLGFLVVLYTTWRVLASPSRAGAAALGVALGVASLLKLSAFVLPGVVVFLGVLRARSLGRRGPTPTAWLGLLAITAASAIFTLNAGYGFDGSFGLLKDATLAPDGRLAAVADAMPWLRLPLPRAFVDGVDMVLEVGKGHEPSYFLAGELSAEGWWYYHLAAFAAKCPLPVLLATLFALAAWIVGRGRGRGEEVVFVALIALFAANTAFNSLYIGERHVLAAYPLAFLAVSPWIAEAIERVVKRIRRAGALAAVGGGRRDLATGAIAVALLVWTAVGTALVAPRYLQFFNEAAGGPSGGHRVLIDSNIDWGQDLVRLREYMDTEGIDRVALAYFGRVDPAVYGIAYMPLERGLSHGKAVVSATFLMGRPYFWILGGRLRWVPSGAYTWLQGLEPVARVGSMFVFDLPGPSGGAR